MGCRRASTPRQDMKALHFTQVVACCALAHPNQVSILHRADAPVFLHMGYSTMSHWL